MKARGENHGRARLTWKKVAEIREKYASGRFLQRELAAEYNISQETVSMVVNRRIWK